MKRCLIIVAACLAAFASSGCKTAYGEQEATVRSTAKQGTAHQLARPGYSVFDADADGRLWVFKSSDSGALLEYSKSKELAMPPSINSS